MRDVGTFEVVMRSKAKPAQGWLATTAKAKASGEGGSSSSSSRRQGQSSSEEKEESQPHEEGGIPVSKDDRATVKETCPKCHHPDAKFHTQQTRSADEGQTCFYTCMKCKHVWTQDN